jgi:hypothetical protein
LGISDRLESKALALGISDRLESKALALEIFDRLESKALALDIFLGLGWGDEKEVPLVLKLDPVFIPLHFYDFKNNKLTIL